MNYYRLNSKKAEVINTIMRNCLTTNLGRHYSDLIEFKLGITEPIKCLYCGKMMQYEKDEDGLYCYSCDCEKFRNYEAQLSYIESIVDMSFWQYKNLAFGT